MDCRFEGGSLDWFPAWTDKRKHEPYRLGNCVMADFCIMRRLCTQKAVKDQIEVANCCHKASFLARMMSVRRKCPKLRHKCPNFFRAFCQRFVCFHTHSGFERTFLTSFFVVFPSNLLGYKDLRSKFGEFPSCRTVRFPLGVSGQRLGTARASSPPPTRLLAPDT